MGRLLPLWAAIALVLQGVALPAPRAEEGAGLLAKGPVLALKEDRGSGGSSPLLWTPPKPPRALPGYPREERAPRPAGPPARPGLYLLYLRLQLDGG
ncbi:hypothetical protein FJNA_10500 [Thermus sp. FJN-A]